MPKTKLDYDKNIFRLKEYINKLEKENTKLRLNNNLLQVKMEQKMSCPVLPKRVFNSPLIEFANFEDGSHVNLIRLIKPYANGYSYAVHETTKSPFCSSGMFKTYDKAKEKFELMVHNAKYESKLINGGSTSNKREIPPERRQELIERLLKIHCDQKQDDEIYMIYKFGFKGYNNMTDKELEGELKNALDNLLENSI
jgi:hypothetical protein